MTDFFGPHLKGSPQKYKEDAQAVCSPLTKTHIASEFTITYQMSAAKMSVSPMS